MNCSRRPASGTSDCSTTPADRASCRSSSRSSAALWSAVDDKPKRVPGAELARVRWLRRRPEASLCVDLYDDDWSRLAWVQVLGRVEVLDVAAGAAALDALAAKYEQYRERQPAGPLLRLAPERAVHWPA